MGAKIVSFLNTILPPMKTKPLSVNFPWGPVNATIAIGGDRDRGQDNAEGLHPVAAWPICRALGLAERD